MDVKNSAATESDARVLVITRIFDAPRSLVFKAWTDPQHIVRWWGPRGFTSTIVGKFGVWPGGTYRIHMHSAEGTDHWTQGIYREVVEPERLVMAGAWTDADGKPISPETVTTITFEEHEGKTRLTLRNAGFESVAARDSHRGGWNSSLDRLAEYLAKA
ncbi:MAG TPA: SRPBCC domain-containing protein [Candidatus Binataceae bacterium]